MEYNDRSPQSKLFFSLEGVDINDDDALAAFAQQVWEQATAAFAEEQDNHECELHHLDIPGQAPGVHPSLGYLVIASGSGSQTKSSP